MGASGEDIDFSGHQMYGADETAGLLAAEYRETETGGGEVVLFFRDKEGKLAEESVKFSPFIWIENPELLAKSELNVEYLELSGNAPLRTLARLQSMADARYALKHLKKNTRFSASDPHAPFFFINDPVQQYLMWSGRTLFKQIPFSALKRMQVDIETSTTAGFDFPNAHREGDRIIVIAMADSSGWIKTLSLEDMSESELLMRFVELVCERDPDTLEGHNFFNFDLPYLFTRAKRHKVKMALGRDGSTPKSRNSRVTLGDRSINYQRYEVFGRHIVDTYFLARLYDISNRSLQSYGLKPVAIHFGVAAEDRTYIPGNEISTVFEKTPRRVVRYARDDIKETLAISTLLSPIYYAQAQMLPMTYQNVMVRGNASKIDALLLREYLRRRHAVPLPAKSKGFAGGYTDVFITGVRKNVHHCDIQSLYPSLMIQNKIAPQSDDTGVFLELLTTLRDFRINAKQKMKTVGDSAQYTYLNALQGTFKILINSFYGYLGFSQARFSDFEAAERVAAEGRMLLESMIKWIREHGGAPVEIDTDGIYFVPPNYADAQKQRVFEEGLQEFLPAGINVEFDGEYPAMFSYKMKNYALMTKEGEIIMRGAALKSRGLELFQRKFIAEIVRLLLEDKADKIVALRDEYLRAIQNRKWSIQQLAKNETLKESPDRYAEKIKGKSRGRNAAYELAMASSRKYQAGDHISYYVTGSKKSVTVYQSAKLVSEWNPDYRDENILYYQGKLNSLYKKFQEWIPETNPEQGTLF